jgi:hypothetical protein
MEPSATSSSTTECEVEEEDTKPHSPQQMRGMSTLDRFASFRKAPPLPSTSNTPGTSSSTTKHPPTSASTAILGALGKDFETSRVPVPRGSSIISSTNSNSSNVVKTNPPTTTRSNSYSTDPSTKCHEVVTATATATDEANHLQEDGGYWNLSGRQQLGGGMTTTMASARSTPSSCTSTKSQRRVTRLFTSTQLVPPHHRPHPFVEGGEANDGNDDGHRRMIDISAVQIHAKYAPSIVSALSNSDDEEHNNKHIPKNEFPSITIVPHPTIPYITTTTTTNNNNNNTIPNYNKLHHHQQPQQQQMQQPDPFDIINMSDTESSVGRHTATNRTINNTESNYDNNTNSDTQSLMEAFPTNRETFRKKNEAAKKRATHQNQTIDQIESRPWRKPQPFSLKDQLQQQQLIDTTHHDTPPEVTTTDTISRKKHMMNRDTSTRSVQSIAETECTFNSHNHLHSELLHTLYPTQPTYSTTNHNSSHEDDDTNSVLPTETKQALQALAADQTLADAVAANTSATKRIIDSNYTITVPSDIEEEHTEEMPILLPTTNNIREHSNNNIFSSIHIPSNRSKHSNYDELSTEDTITTTSTSKPPQKDTTSPYPHPTTTSSRPTTPAAPLIPSTTKPMSPPSHSAESTYVNHQSNHDTSVIVTAAADLASAAVMVEAQHDTTVDITIPNTEDDGEEENDEDVNSTVSHNTFNYVDDDNNTVDGLGLASSSNSRIVNDGNGNNNNNKNKNKNKNIQIISIRKSLKPKRVADVCVDFDIQPNMKKRTFDYIRRDPFILDYRKELICLFLTGVLIIAGLSVAYSSVVKQNTQQQQQAQQQEEEQKRINNFHWTQIDNILYGSQSHALFGDSISQSSNGYVIAVGSPFDNNSGGSQAGKVSVFIHSHSSSSWNSLGTPILGSSPEEHVGQSVALTGDGHTVAVGSRSYSNNSMTRLGKVAVYSFQNMTWVPKGIPIIGNNSGEEVGFGLDVSEFGRILAYSSWQSNEKNNDNDGGMSKSFAGSVHVMTFDENESMDWVQLGQTLYGKDRLDLFGFSLSLSLKGFYVAIGAPQIDDGSKLSSFGNGYVRVFQYNENTKMWSQVGQVLRGRYAQEWAGAAVSLSHLGDFVAIGSPNRDLVRVYKFHLESNDWVQLGKDIVGPAASNFGISVSLNSNGTIVAVGASHASSNDVPHHGAIQVYLWDPERETWNQLGNSIQGSQPNQMTGNAVCISSTGEVLAGASYGYDTIINGHLASDSGKVNVFYLVQN